MALAGRLLPQRDARRRVVIPAFVCAVLAINAVVIFEPPHSATLHMDAVAHDIMSAADTDGSERVAVMAEGLDSAEMSTPALRQR